MRGGFKEKDEGGAVERAGQSRASGNMGIIAVAALIVGAIVFGVLSSELRFVEKAATATAEMERSDGRALTVARNTGHGGANAAPLPAFDASQESGEERLLRGYRSGEIARNPWDHGGNWTDYQGSRECNDRGYRIRAPRRLGTGQSGDAADLSYCDCFVGYAGERCERVDARGGPGRPVTGAVVVLMYGDHDLYLRETTRFLKTFYRHFYRLFPRYDVVIFYSAATFSAADLQSLSGAAHPMPVRFESVEIDFPEAKRKEFEAMKKRGDRLGKTCWPKGAPWEYLDMCRFFTALWFRSPVLRDYDYVWRLDGNLYLQRDVECDVFLAMARSRALLGFYSWRNTERPGCQGNIREKAFAYARRNGFGPSHLADLGLKTGRTIVTHYSAGWTMFKWSFWSSPAQIAFADEIDATGIAYYNRAEQVFHGNSLALFAPRTALHQFGGFGPFLHRSSPMWGPKAPAVEHILPGDRFCPALTSAP